MRISTIMLLAAPLLTGCATVDTLPPLERADVECAVEALSKAEGVHKVAVETGLGSAPLIIRYDYSERDGTRHGARILVDGWAPPGQPIGYDFQLIDDRDIAGISDLVGPCFQGMTVVTD